MKYKTITATGYVYDKRIFREFFIKRTLEILMPFDYNDSYSCIDNANQEFIIKSFTLFDIPIIIVGLFLICVMAEAGSGNDIKRMLEEVHKYNEVWKPSQITKNKTKPSQEGR